MIMESMDRWMEFGASWLSLLCLASWRALPIFIAVFAIAIVIRRRFTPAIHALLWTLVIARFLLPISLASPVSVHSRIDTWSDSLLESRDQPQDAPTPPTLPDANIVKWTPSAEALPSVSPSPTDWEVIFGCLFFFTLILVTLLLLLRSAISYVRFARRLGNCCELHDPSLVDMLLRECDQIGVGRRPKVYEVPALATPAVFGVFRPSICLPQGFLSKIVTQELRWVLRHELAHIRRRDTIVMVFASFAQSIHWFNPLIWFSVRRLRASMEAAADRLALTNTSSLEAAAYGQLLVRLAENQPNDRNTFALGLLPFASAKPLKQRLERLMDQPKPNGRVWKTLTAALVLSIAVLGLTDAAETPTESPPEVFLMKGEANESAANVSVFEFDPWPVNSDDGPTLLKVYHIASIFDSMPQVITESDQDQKSQLLTWMPVLKRLEERMQVEDTKLIAKLTEAQHELLAAELERWMHGQPRQIVMEARVMQTSLQCARAIDWIRDRIDGIEVKGPGPAMAARISDTELGQLVQRVQSDPRSNILLAPKVTIFAGQSALVSDESRELFVTGIKLLENRAVEPVITVLDEGLRLSLTADQRKDDSISLRFNVRTSKIEDVSYANLPVRLPQHPDPHITVQVPNVSTKEVSSSVELEEGESVIIAIPNAFDLSPERGSDALTIVALTPRLIELTKDEIEQNQKVRE